MKDKIALVIPTSILILRNKELNANDKLVFGLHYAHFRKQRPTLETNIEIKELINLHPNIVSRCNLKLLKKQYIKRVTGGFEVIEETLNQLSQPKGTMEIILPFEVYGRKNIGGGEKLLWGEFNKFRNTEYGCYETKETVANNIGCSKISVISWERKLLEQRMIQYGEYRNKRTVFTVDFRDLPTEAILPKEQIQTIVNEPLPIADKEKQRDKKMLDELSYKRGSGGVSVYKPPKKKKKNKKTKEEKEQKKHQLEEEKQRFLTTRKQLEDSDFYDDMIY